MQSSVTNLIKSSRMADAANERKGKSARRRLINSKLTIVLVASMMCDVASAVECYWCSGVGPDRRCELAPQNSSAGSISVKCPMRYCITTKVINAVNGEVESFARNCDTIPHGNTCVRDTHLITCFQTCTTDLCNSGNPDPSHLGFRTQGSEQTSAKNRQDIEGRSRPSQAVVPGVGLHDSPLARVGQRVAQGANTVNRENGKVNFTFREKIVPYKSKLGRYVVNGNTVRFLTTSPRHWWVTDISSTSKAVNNNHNKFNDDDSISISAAATSSSRINTGKSDDAPQSSKRSPSSGNAREETATEKSRHTFDYLGYSPSIKPKPTRTTAVITRKRFSETSATSASPTSRSKKMWYDQSDPTTTSETGTSSPSTITSVPKDKSETVLTQNVLNKPSRPTQPTEKINTVQKNNKQYIKSLPEATKKDQSEVAKETSKQTTKSKGDNTKSTDVAELLPILEALITDGYITLNEDKLSSERATTTTTPEAPTQQPTYGLLEAANVFTSHVHGKTHTQRPIHQTMNRRYKKKFFRDQHGSVRPVQSKAFTSKKIVPEPYIVSFFNRGRQVNRTNMQAAVETEKPAVRSEVPDSRTRDPKTVSETTNPDVTFKTQDSTVTSKNVMQSETSKVLDSSTVMFQQDNIDRNRDIQFESSTRKTTMISDASTDKNLNSFWQQLSKVSKKPKSEKFTPSLLKNQIQLKPITPVPTDVNSLTVAASSNIDLRNTSPSQGVVDSVNKSIDLDLTSPANTNNEKSSVPEIQATQSSGKPETTPAVKYVSIYPNNKFGGSNKKDKGGRKRYQSKAFDTNNKLSLSESVKNSEVSDVDNLVDDAPIQQDDYSGLKTEFRDEHDTFTILTESKKNSQKSELYSAALTNADYLNEINRKIGEKLQSVEEGSTKDYSELHASTRAITTTRSDMVSKTEPALSIDTTETVVLIASSVGNVTEESARKDLTATPSVEVIQEKEVVVSGAVTEKPAQLNQAVNSTQKTSPINPISSGQSSADVGRHSETRENLFRTTGVNADFTFKASVWTDSPAESTGSNECLPNVKMAKDSHWVSVKIQQADVIEKSGNDVEDTLIEKSERKLVTYEITLEPTSVSLLRARNVSDTRNSSVQVILNRADEAEISRRDKSSETFSPSVLSPVNEKSGGTTLTPPSGESRDNSVILAYEDTMSEILRNVRVTASPETAKGSRPAGLSSRSTQSPTIYIKPAVHVPGKIAKLEGKKKLFSSKRDNSSSSVYKSTTFWHLLLVLFITVTRF